MYKFIVPEELENQRLDLGLAKLSGQTRTTIQHLLEKKLVVVNQTLATKKNYRLKTGDCLEIIKLIEKVTTVVPKKIDFEIIFEDESLLVVNKPSGMVTHPGANHYDDTLVNGLLYKYHHLSNLNGPIRPGIVHRLDKDTSGLLLVAKNNQTHLFLAEQLANHLIHRTYWAIVEGQIKEKILHLKLPIGRDPHDRQKMKVTKLNSKKAVTHVYVEKIYKDKTLIRCVLETGRTHQIRVHLAYIKHPIVGDHTYGNSNDPFGQYLHAKEINFQNSDGEKLVFKAPLPDQFQKMLTQLEN